MPNTRGRPTMLHMPGLEALLLAPAREWARRMGAGGGVHLYKGEAAHLGVCGGRWEGLVDVRAGDRERLHLHEAVRDVAADLHVVQRQPHELVELVARAAALGQHAGHARGVHLEHLQGVVVPEVPQERVDVTCSRGGVVDGCAAGAGAGGGGTLGAAARASG